MLKSRNARALIKNYLEVFWQLDTTVTKGHSIHNHKMFNKCRTWWCQIHFTNF